ncbi:MAG: hypothetical protein ACI4PO_00975 [Faecousia sp.]
MKHKNMNFVGILLLILQAVGNLLHLLWTVWAVAEQVQTGWGYGTDMEIAVLIPWMLELLCIPVLVVAAAYLILSIWHRGSRGIFIANLSLFAALILQAGLTNLFIWF